MFFLVHKAQARGLCEAHHTTYHQVYMQGFLNVLETTEIIKGAAY
jgi:hypothetical protein